MFWYFSAAPPDFLALTPAWPHWRCGVTKFVLAPRVAVKKQLWNCTRN